MVSKKHRISPISPVEPRLETSHGRELQAVFQGGGTPAASLVPPSLWGYDASLKPYKYDPDGAKKLLAEAGYPSGFTIDLWAIPVVRAYMPNGRRTAEMIQADWAKIGVKANIVKGRAAARRRDRHHRRSHGDRARPQHRAHPAHQRRG